MRLSIQARDTTGLGFFLANFNKTQTTTRAQHNFCLEAMSGSLQIFLLLAQRRQDYKKDKNKLSPILSLSLVGYYMLCLADLKWMQ